MTFLEKSSSMKPTEIAAKGLSQNPLASVSFPRTGKRGVPQQFPRRLYEMLEAETIMAESSSNLVKKDVIISWSDSGKAFHIRNITDFANTILPKYFRTKKFSSFQRNLNLYGFAKLRRGPEVNMYAHTCFRRGVPEELVHLRKASSGTTVSANSPPASPRNTPCLSPQRSDSSNHQQNPSPQQELQKNYNTALNRVVLAHGEHQHLYDKGVKKTPQGQPDVASVTGAMVATAATTVRTTTTRPGTTPIIPAPSSPSHSDLKYHQQALAAAAAAAAAAWVSSAKSNSHPHGQTPNPVRNDSSSCSSVSASCASSTPMSKPTPKVSSKKRKQKQQPGTKTRAISPSSSSCQDSVASPSSFWSPSTTSTANMCPSQTPSNVSYPSPPPLFINRPSSFENGNTSFLVQQQQRTSTQLLPRWATSPANNSGLLQCLSSPTTTSAAVTISSSVSKSLQREESDCMSSLSSRSQHESQEETDQEMNESHHSDYENKQEESSSTASTLEKQEEQQDQEQPHKDKNDRGRLDLLFMAMEREMLLSS